MKSSKPDLLDQVINRYNAQVKICDILTRDGLDKGLIALMLNYVDQVESGPKVMQKKFAKKGLRLVKLFLKSKNLGDDSSRVLKQLAEHFEKFCE